MFQRRPKAAFGQFFWRFMDAVAGKRPFQVGEDMPVVAQRYTAGKSIGRKHSIQQDEFCHAGQKPLGRTAVQENPIVFNAEQHSFFFFFTSGLLFADREFGGSLLLKSLAMSLERAKYAFCFFSGQTNSRAYIHQSLIHAAHVVG